MGEWGATCVHVVSRIQAKPTYRHGHVRVAAHARLRESTITADRFFAGWGCQELKPALAALVPLRLLEAAVLESGPRAERGQPELARARRGRSGDGGAGVGGTSRPPSRGFGRRSTFCVARGGPACTACAGACRARPACRTGGACFTLRATCTCPLSSPPGPGRAPPSCERARAIRICLHVPKPLPACRCPDRRVSFPLSPCPPLPSGTPSVEYSGRLRFVRVMPGHCCF